MKTKSLIAALLLAASSAFAQVPSYVPTNGLVGWWPFNGNANDESGNGNNGVANGQVNYVSDRFGAPSNSVFFQPSSVINTLNLQPASCEFTFSLWLKIPLGYNSGGSAIRFANTATGNSSQVDKMIQVLSPINSVALYVYPGYPIYLTSPNSISDNQWHHLVASTSPAGMYLYLDGVLVSTNSNTSCENYAGYWRMELINGTLDDLGIWNRALTQQEITNLYNAQSCTGTGAITADGPTTFCAGNYVNLTSDVVGGTYQWKKNGVNVTSNGTSRTYKATATGSYTCVATCNGTALTSNAIVVTSKTNAFASVSASGATSFCAGDSVTLNCTNLGSNYSVQWYRTNVSIENATNYSLLVKQPGTYKVVTKNLTTGCSRISGSAITTNVNCRIANNNLSEPTSNDINEESRTLAPELSQGVNLFPNPNNGSFKFIYEGEVEGEGTIQVISAMGQVIYQSQATAEDGRISKEIFLGDHYQKGIYIVRLLINGGQNDSRMIVQ
jgi:hypothetical protein